MMLTIAQLEPILPEAALDAPEIGASLTVTALDLLNQYAHVFFIAFAVTMLATPVVRRLAVSADIIDHPDQTRKSHGAPIAYLGGMAVFLGLIAAIGASYWTGDDHSLAFRPVPWAIIVGMVAITFTGLADDIWGWDPRLKTAGQLVAAAALAIEDIGVRVADGMLHPIMGAPEEVLFTLLGYDILNGHVFYWVGTAIIAFFVLGGCNAANFIDGLDGLLSGVVAIVAIGLLIIALLMASALDVDQLSEAGGSLAGARIVLCLALLGAALGFLPHNFNPAVIFLGDSGSLLLGYTCVAIILMLGEAGQTHIVFAGLIVFGLPVMDTTLAIIRRLLAGTSISAADNHHVHHQLRRGLGGVKRAVFAMYGISLLFGALGVTLAALVMLTELRVRIVYAVAFIVFSFIGVIAVKEARKQQLQIQPSAKRAAANAARSAPPRAIEPAPAQAFGAESQPGSTPVAAPRAPSSAAAKGSA